MMTTMTMNEEGMNYLVDDVRDWICVWLVVLGRVE